ncbi:MAG: ABC transporter substrate-binding protein [Anaerolineae bacterium]
MCSLPISLETDRPPRLSRGRRPSSRGNAVRLWHRWCWTLLVLLTLAACSNPPTPTAKPTVSEPTRTVPPSPTAQPTEPPQRLILCTTEPQAVSPFVRSQSGQDLLGLFYEEAIERVDYGWEARLVERVPSIAAGDVVTELVSVMSGMRYADELGIIRLHDSDTPLQLPQLKVTFTLTSDLFWSDGAPITSKDAILGYHLAQAPEAEGRWRDLAERTAQFVAVDEATLRWEGIPGYLDSDYPGFLFPLQPSHRWQGQTLTTILTDRTPPATGAYRIAAWEAHREVRLEPNAHYSGPSPILETVIVRFPQQNPDHWTSLLVDGTCDLILPDPIMGTSWQPWAQLGAAGEAVLWADAAPTVLRLDLNLDPQPTPEAETDAAERSPLQDPRVRQAMDLCIDREGLTQALPTEALIAAGGFIPPNHPAHSGSPSHYDPDLAKNLLDEAGWRDSDGDGFREAVNAPDFEVGSALKLDIHFASQYFVLTAHIAADLELCGIKANLQPVTANQLYTAGSTSPLFGRHFDAVLLGWYAEVPEACGSWLSNRIPNEENNWSGENFSGFASASYDEACRQAISAVDAAEEAAALQEAQRQLSETRPALFLAWRPFWFAARPEVQGLKPDASAYSTIWNIEAIRIANPEGQ